MQQNIIIWLAITSIFSIKLLKFIGLNETKGFDLQMLYKQINYLKET